jgi:hypothetical protein
MNLQGVIVALIVLLALIYLLRYFWPSEKNSNCGGCDIGKKSLLKKQDQTAAQQEPPPGQRRKE